MPIAVSKRDIGEFLQNWRLYNKQDIITKVEVESAKLAFRLEFLSAVHSLLSIAIVQPLLEFIILWNDIDRPGKWELKFHN